MPQVKNISKGQRISCGRNINEISVLLNWDSNFVRGSCGAEIDVSAFLLMENGKVKNDEGFIFYNNPVSADNSVIMNAVCENEAKIDILPAKFDPKVSKIAVTLTIHNAKERSLNFSSISSVTARIYADKAPIAAYCVDNRSFTTETAIVICDIYLRNGEWRVAAVGSGFNDGLGALCSVYGVEEDKQEYVPIKAGAAINPKRRNKPVYTPATRDEIFICIDAVLLVQKSINALLKKSNSVAATVFLKDPEAFDAVVYVSVLYMSDRIKIERGLKSEIVKRILSGSKRFSGLDLIEKETLQELLDGAFDRMNYIDVKDGIRSINATSLYCVIICAFGQILLKSVSELSDSDADVYKDILNILGSFDLDGAYNLLALRNDISVIKALNEWYEEYIATGILFEDETLSLEELLEELNSLTGLKEVKNDVSSLINMLTIQQMRKEQNLPIVPMSLHLVFSGNPGTGKTTVARLVAKIYKAMGLLEKGHLIEVDRSALVAGYVGQTAIKVSKAVESAMGGVLFIDEAYSLTLNRGEQDFGREAVDTLLKIMEDKRDAFIVIVAGYTNEMRQFLQSNPGLQSRFNKFIEFKDYEPRELLSIFKGMCANSHLILSRDAERCASAFFTAHYQNRDENYANARDVRNYYEKVLVAQANRLSKQNSVSKEDLMYIKLEDTEHVNL